MTLNKKLIYLSTICALVCNFANADRKINDVTLSGVEIIQFSSTVSQSITSGEISSVELTRYNSKNNTSTLTITTTENRKGSITPVNWIQGQLNNLGIDWVAGNMFGNSSGGDSTPEKLNFALQFPEIIFRIDGTNNVTCENFMIGQGHAFPRNNWWIFANDPNTPNSHRLELDSNNGMNINLALICHDSENRRIKLFVNRDYNNTGSNFHISTEPLFWYTGPSI